MARPIYAINLTAVGVSIDDLSGLYIDPYDTVDLRLFFSIDQIDFSDDLEAAILAGDIVLNDGENNLTLEESQEISSVSTFFDIPVDFLDLRDTPSTYSGQNDRFVIVNPSASGVLFTDTIDGTFYGTFSGTFYGGDGQEIVHVNHGNLDGLDGDDHLQYVLVDGSRGFTFTVSGVDPVQDYHLTTKGYVDDAVASVGGGGSFYNSSTGQSSTTSTSWQQKVRLTFTPPSAGDYEITFSMMQSHSDTGVMYKTRVQVDNSTTYYSTREEFYNFKYSDGAYRMRGGSFTVNLSAQQHNIDLDYRTGESGKAAYIKEAYIIARGV